MMQERGVEVDPSTIMGPSLRARARKASTSLPRYGSSSWRLDETYVKVAGSWKYLFRTVDKHGRLIDFMLLER